MSRDIRSFFQSKKVKVEEDDDIIPDSPDVQIKIKKKESKKKRVINDDSDEEIFTSKKKKTNRETLNQKNKSSAKPSLKEVKATDIFGSGPIKRTQPTVKKVKEMKVTETGIHSELDAVEDEVLKSAEKSSTSKDVDEMLTGNKKAEMKKDISPVKLTDTKNEDHSKKYNEVKHNKEKDRQSPGKPKNGSKEQKSKLDSKVNNDNKRKFSDFLEDETKHGSEKSDEEKTIKKKKLNESATENKPNNTKNIKNEADEEFNDSDVTILEDSVLDESMLGKRKKFDKSLNETILTDEERHERRIQSAALYKSYLNRSGPKHLGSKEIPEGAPDCLKDCAFLLTGVLDSFEREEVADAIAKYGGTIKNSISKKVTHVLAGEEAGPAKMAKAQDLGIKIIGEDEFIQMIKDSSNKKTKEKEVKRDKLEIKKEKTPNSKLGKIKAVPKEIDSKTKNKSNDTVRNNESNENVRDERINGHNSKDKKIQSPSKAEALVKSENKAKVKTEPVPKFKTEPETKVLKVSGSELKMDAKMAKADLNVNGSSSKSDAPLSLMWVDKYKPQNVKQIIGQHGDASNVKKLSNWLTKWYVNRKAKLPKPSPWAKNDDGGYYKAALLSGPPGVGKTTTVALVCKELGFDMVEFNASDTRSKNLIKQQIGELLTTTSLSGYANGDTGKQAVTKKHVLVMDEVDGMAGNEDRGGMQELIGLIKSSSVPIVCMCNDRNSQKMRSLVNYCYDLRFSRPRIDQIKSAMMSICFKEGLKIPPDVITQLITAANQDVRQTLHLLSMWAAEPDTDKMRKDATSIRKDIKLGPWEAIRKVFSAEDHKKMSIHDKSDLFFYDYSLAPLFVFENYLQVAPHCPKKEVLDRLSKAADSISAGDLVDARIRRSQAWGLLPTQAMYSSVIPGHFLSGHVTGQIQFPGWLGKNSRAGKMRRLGQEIHAHTRLSTTGSKSSVFLDYSIHLRDAIVNPLIKDKADGVPKSLEALEAYHLLREDLDALSELALWPGQRDPMALVDSKVKAAMTRTYNKSAAALPYAPGPVRKGRARDDADADDDDGELDDPNDSDSDPENDALIKKKKTNIKPSASKDKASSSKEKATSSKDKSSLNKGKKKNKC